MTQIKIYDDSIGAEIEYEIPEGVMKYIEGIEALLVTMEDERREDINTFYQN